MKVRLRSGRVYQFGFLGPLFNAEAMRQEQRMAEYFRTLVAAVVSRPDVPLASMPMLAETERQQLLVDWNDTAAEYPKFREWLLRVDQAYGRRISVFASGSQTAAR